MATYALYTASYGSNYANLRVRILEQGTGVPAIVMASASSGILSSHGNALLDSSGNLSVFLDNSKTWQVWNNQFILVPNQISIAQEIQRTSAQIGAAPTLADIALGPGATFYLDTNPAAQYRISADKTQYSLITGGGGASSFSSLTDKATATIATTNTSVANALATKVTNVGTFASTGALQTAFPAAANSGSLALVGASAPYTSYTSNGSSWVAAAGGGSVGSAAPASLASAASAGTDTLSSRQDHVHAYPSPAQLNAFGIPVQYDFTANPSGFTSGVAPSGNNSYIPTGAATTAYFSADNITSVAATDWIYFDGAHWQQVKGAALGVVIPNGILVASDGTSTGGTSSARAAVPGVEYMPGSIGQTAVPFGVPPSGVIGSNGALTLGIYGGGTISLSFSATSGSGVTCTSSASYFAATDAGQAISLDSGKIAFITGYTNASSVTVTLSTTLSGTGPFTNFYKGYAVGYGTNNANTFGNTWCYFPANAVTSSSAAGMYLVQWSSPMGGTVYNNYISTGSGVASPIPASVTPTAFSGTTGSTYVSPTSTIYLANFAVPANYMGANGRLTLTALSRNNNSANNKTMKVGFGMTGGLTMFNQTTSTVTAAGGISVVMNTGSTSNQVAPSLLSVNPTGENESNLDTTAIQYVYAQATLVSANDWAFFRQFVLDGAPRS